MGSFQGKIGGITGYMVGTLFSLAGGPLGMLSGLFMPLGVGGDLSGSSSGRGKGIVQVDGFGQTTLSSQEPVPIVFGETMLSGNITSAYLLGDNNNRLVTAICLGEAPLTLKNLWVDGRLFNTLENFAASRGNDQTNSWFEFYANGEAASISIANSGRKHIGNTAYEGNSVETYPISLLGGVSPQVRIDLTHYAPAAGSAQSWVIKAKEENDVDFITLGSYSQYFIDYVEYQVAPGGSCFGSGGMDTKYSPVESTTRTSHTFTLSGFGKWTIRLEVTAADNAGFIIFEAVEVINDSGALIQYNYPNTAYCLINLVKTASISRSLSFYQEVSGYTDNPATALKNILEDPDIGLNISSELDDNSFIAAAGFCDSKGYTLDLAFLDINFGEALKMIMHCGRLMLIRTGGVYKCLPEEDSAVTVSFDTASNIIPGSLEWHSINKDEKFNRLRVKYADSQENYTIQDLILEDIAQIESDGYVREEVLDLRGVTSMAKAADLGNISLKKSKFINIYVSFEIGLKDALVEIGDIIQLTASDLNFTDKQFRVVKIEETGNFGYKIYATEHFSQIYDSDITVNNWHPQSLDFGGLDSLGVSQLSIDQISQSVGVKNKGYYSIIDITYTVPAEGFDHAELWARPLFQGNPVFVNISDNGTFTYYPPEAYVPYEFRLVAVDKERNKSDISQAPRRTFYPNLAPYSTPGYGGGRYGIQPYGY
ncbi:MAG: phage tail protein [bacterium]